MLGVSMPPAESLEPLRCSFCHKSQDVVAKLISSPSDRTRVYICDECVGVCSEILNDDAKDAEQTSAPSPFAFKTPLEEATLPTEAVLKRIQKLEAKARGKLQKKDLPARKVILSAGISLDGYIARSKWRRGFSLHAQGLFDGVFFRCCRHRRHGTQDL